MSRILPKIKISDENSVKEALSGDDIKGSFHLAGQLLKTKPRNRSILFNFLDHARSTKLLQKIYKENKENEWFELCLKIIEKSNFTLGHLFRRRAEQYNHKTLFRKIEGNNVIEFSWLEIKEKVNSIAGALLALSKSERCDPVAILSENSPEMACIDLGCLLTGIVNVPIAANSLDHSIAYMLNHSEVRTVFVSDEKQLSKILKVKENLNNLQNIIIIAPSEKFNHHEKIMTLEKFLQKSKEVSESDILSAIEEVKLADLATIMYTSGTTEMPKGIMFSHLNIISKRFARALALPEIGEKDTFLCYLPLYHTFGRYFELMGCIFWGCTYNFMSGTQIETVIENMRMIKPTVFISIPQKWIQLYEKIQEAIDIQTSPHEEIGHKVADATGGRLRWGLSAAGYLDPEIFQFFQRYGVELMSGFGMTEATGGITMTPPFNYRPNSVGKALPGIDIKLEDDGEMKIRGPYVMMGYLKEKSTGQRDGWLHTGDIFTLDNDGFYQIIDRKKEIYKNVKGQTISPQKIENLFKEFESIKSVFLVGDHREHNTLLLYPNYAYDQFNLKKLNPTKLREFFGSLIVSVNRFLAPFERIIDFEIINRDFAVAYGELTPKGTYKRKAIEENFNEPIMNMYGAKYIKIEIPNNQLRIPKWFLREKGLTANDLKLNRNSLKLPNNVSLRIKTIGNRSNLLQIGSLVYQSYSKFVDLAELINSPLLWIGNLELEKFAGEHILQRSLIKINQESSIELRIAPKGETNDRKLLKKLDILIKNKTYDLQGTHIAAYLVYNSKVNIAQHALDYLAGVIEEKSELTSRIASGVLLRIANHPHKLLRRHAFAQMICVDKHHSPIELLKTFLLEDDSLLDKGTNNKIAEKELSETQLKSIFSFLQELNGHINRKNKNTVRKQTSAVLDLITTYGIKHPVAYKSIRAELVRWSLISKDKQVRNQAKIFVEKLEAAFRAWLGPNQTIAVDPETGQEFHWHDVITCEEGSFHSGDIEKIVTAIKNFPLIKEAIFLFSGRTLIRLEDIAHKGVWVSFLGALHGKTVYRVSVQTRNFGLFDLVININKELSRKDIAAETAWLICAGSQGSNPPVVEDFGGYWQEFDLWTEEFIPGENVETQLRRLYRPSDPPSLERIQNLWLHFMWSGLHAYVDFWNRTGRIFEIADPTPTNIIVPLSDFQTGSRIVSISSRRPFRTLPEMLTSFYKNFIDRQEKKYPKLKGANRWHIIFSALIETLGENQGLQFLEQAKDELKKQSSVKSNSDLKVQLTKFISQAKREGYLPKRLYFAIRRFNRWLTLNPKATPQAQLQTLQDLNTTYTLDELEKNYPGARIQFFRDTVFINNQKIRASLSQIIRKLRFELENIDLVEQISQLKTHVPLTEHEDFFITRMTFPHLGPEETAALISAGEQGAPEPTLIVFIEDQEGNKFAVRQPVSPKEIAKLHGLYTTANLPIEFRPEHQYLIVISDRGQVVGGLFYRFVEPQYVHLEKIVIDRRYRKKGVSSGLMHQFFNRLKSKNVEIITVGFLRPEFFYRFGFRIEHSYGNMVKWLTQNPF